MSSGYNTVKAGHLLRITKNIPWWMLSRSFSRLLIESHKDLMDRNVSVAACVMVTVLTVAVAKLGNGNVQWFSALLLGSAMSVLQLSMGFIGNQPKVRMTDEEGKELDQLLRFSTLKHAPRVSKDSQQDEVSKSCIGSLRVLAGDVMDLEDRLMQKQALPRSAFGILAQIELLENDLEEARERFFDHYEIMRGLKLVSISKENLFKR